LKEKRTPKSKATTGKRSIKNIPDTLGNKKPNLPKTTNYRPGMLLPQSITMARTRSTAKLDLDSDTEDDTAVTEALYEDFQEAHNRLGFGELSEDWETHFRNYQNRQMSEEGDTESENSETEEFHGFENYDPDDMHMDIDLDNINNTSDETDEDMSIRDNDSQTDSDNEDTLDNVPNRRREEADDTEEEEENDDESTLHNYTDVRTVTNIIAEGTLTLKQFKDAQYTDDYCTTVVDNLAQMRQFVIKEGLLFKKTKDTMKLVLPRSLFDAVIFTRHFTVFGSHNSATRIERDTLRQYFIPGKEFQKKLKNVTKNCYICQLFNMREPSEHVKQLPKVNAPRISWSIDLITDAPTTTKGNKQILLCVDDFSSYVTCIPITTATAENILDGLKSQLFSQFGTPKIIRSDQQSSFYNSTTFFEELKKLGIELTTTAVASPFSNARAESQIKNIKHLMRKFLFQEAIKDKWDEYLQMLTNSHNKSTGIYGYSSEELMFGTKTPSKIDILDFYGPNDNVDDYVQHVMPIAEGMRKEARTKMDKKAEQNRTFKNRNKTLKEFEVGTLVLHKQLQASTGMSSKYKPLYTGPYVIVKINKDRCTAILEHMKTGRMIKAHFTNMQYLYYAPEINRLSHDFDAELFNMLGNKYTLNKYGEAKSRHPGSDLVRSDSPEY
jgi:ribosomal protein L21E